MNCTAGPARQGLGRVANDRSHDSHCSRTAGSPDRPRDDQLPQGLQVVASVLTASASERWRTKAATPAARAAGALADRRHHEQGGGGRARSAPGAISERRGTDRGDLYQATHHDLRRRRSSKARPRRRRVHRFRGRRQLVTLRPDVRPPARWRSAARARSPSRRTGSWRLSDRRGMAMCCSWSPFCP